MMYSKNYVCITGASSGIGLETAKAFASLENNLILVARRQERLEKLKEELPKAEYCCQISRPFYFRECL